MISLYPIRIYEDRYGGSYSGGAWVAVDLMGTTREVSAIEEGILGSDGEVMMFRTSVKNEIWIAVGRRPTTLSQL
jgi:hypothetical protein